MLLLAVVVLSGTATVKAEIQRQYDRWSKAYIANDVPVLLSILTPDYRLTTVDKTVVDHAEYEAKIRLRSEMRADPTSYSTQIISLAVKDGEADVRAVETMESHLEKPRRTVFHRHHYLDHWVHPRKAWLLKSTVTVGESTTVK